MGIVFIGQVSVSAAHDQAGLAAAHRADRRAAARHRVRASAGPRASARRSIAVSVDGARPGRPRAGAAIGVAYCIGLGIPFLLVAIGFGWVGGSVRWVKRHIRAVNIAGGVLLIVIGVLMVSGLWRGIISALGAVIQWLRRTRSDSRRATTAARPSAIRCAPPTTSTARRSTTPRGVTQPRLNLVGYLRFFWRQLTSMRTALILLLLLALGRGARLAGAAAQLRPERRRRSTRPNNPDTFKILDSLGLFSTFTSPWFSAIYLLLFVSLVGCIIPRAEAPPRRAACQAAQDARPARAAGRLQLGDHDDGCRDRRSPRRAVAAEAAGLPGRALRRTRSRPNADTCARPAT